jgi:hypothetical protein
MPFIGQDGVLYGGSAMWELVTFPDADVAPLPLPELAQREFEPPPPASSPVWQQWWRGNYAFFAPPRLAVGVYGDPSDT